MLITSPTFAIIGLALNLQTAVAQTTAVSRVDGNQTTPRVVAPPTDTSATAARAESAISIDARDDDAAWKGAPVITAFQEWRPNEGKPARFKTEAKIVYDAANLYVFVRAFDPHPDSIKKILERRDSFTSSDMIWLFIDSYHDKRTGYEFGVNAAGVKMDAAIYDDGNEDFAWDAVWDVDTKIDSLGWTAEFRIPLSQMRYGKGREHTFGIMVDRDVYRYNERYIWPLLRQSKPGFVSQFGSLHGMDDLEEPRKLELMPYVVTKSASTITNNAFNQKQNVAIGGDLKYRLAPNVTLDATINPDFGQVESDPSVLNLSAYESFFDERRPFFVAGRGLFRADVNCSAVNCWGETLYYSRRIGRTPELAGTYGDTVPQQPITILGAGKLLARFPTGTTIGALEAITQRETNPGDTTYSPGTNYAVLRASQDFRGGNSGIGTMITAVNRSNDQWTTPYLASSAYVGSIDFRHRFFKNNYEISGAFDQSLVRGSTDVITALQTNGVHGFQRPDANLPLNESRTELSGNAEEFRLGKIGGQHLMFESAYSRRSPGFEANDLGYLRRADQISWSTWMGYFDRQDRLFYHRFQFNDNWWQWWTSDGLPLERAYNYNTHITLKNYWGFHQGATFGQLGKTYDDRQTRGGPAVRQDMYYAPWLSINGDDRKAWVPYFNASYFQSSDKRNWSVNFSPELDLKLMGRFSSVVALNWSHNVQDNQFYGQFTDATDVVHYTIAHLDQQTTALTTRFNYTFTPALSLQTYLQPFISKGTYSNVRQLSANPRADKYDDRYAPYNDPSVTDDPGGFNFKALQSNVVMRWEYKPGSTLFLVWNQGRQGFNNIEGDRAFTGDIRDLMSLHPANTFLIKVSYWLNR
ncbi:MAG TPA: DUF5916 domain-containing protein [Gemmatimonadaceae bacterium]|nr:DUF5916 domain-containing protein [Gemmatimonadaceae bacterium]